MTFEEAKKINHYAELEKRFKAHYERAMRLGNTARAFLAADCMARAQYAAPLDISTYSDRN